MSYDIDYKRKVYFIRPGKLSDDDLLAITLIGPSNCFEIRWDGRDGRRTRDWHMVALGWHYQLMKKVCMYAGECDGGMLQVRGKYIKPENYIKLWRKAIKERAPIEEFFKEFHMVEGVIYPPKKPKSWEVEDVKKLKKIGQKQKPYDQVRYVFPIKNVKDLRTFQDLRCLGQSYLNARNGEEV